ncbi:hypothetical protein MIPYR_20214 [uncultured Microbacterium sp.]|uniref:Uncharacterized protein n=1 Tax=uncultured Microbacterium sp. TaxID=191216 RepID=A0A1Y5P384_9MICO|nr:hypothetical protein MIPYR_20214 [uncultured Microbacterium sp.]
MGVLPRFSASSEARANMRTSAPAGKRGRPNAASDRRSCCIAQHSDALEISMLRVGRAYATLRMPRDTRGTFGTEM